MGHDDENRWVKIVRNDTAAVRVQRAVDWSRERLRRAGVLQSGASQRDKFRRRVVSGCSCPITWDQTTRREEADSRRRVVSLTLVEGLYLEVCGSFKPRPFYRGH